MSLDTRTGSASAPATGPSAEPAVESGLTFPASYAQRRMWFFHRMDRANPFYNVSLVLHLRGPVDEGLLRAAVVDVVDRHEILRTTYLEIDGELHQQVHPSLPADLTTDRLGAVDPATAPADVVTHPAVAERLRTRARQPFDLGTGPVLRVDLTPLGPATAVGGEAALLMLSLHHIAVDGWSLGVLLADLDRAYQARTLGQEPVWDGLEIQYGDYAEWQRERLTGADLPALLGPWRERLARPPAALALATDRPQPPDPAFTGRRLDFTLEPDLIRGLRELARTHGCSLFMTLLAGWSALLRRLTGDDDLLIGTLFANRENPQIQPLVGLFVNTLPARVDTGGDPGFATLLGRVRETVLQLAGDQDMPVEMIVDDVRPERIAGVNPLFQVVFALQNFADHRLGFAGTTVTRLDIERGSTRFTLELHVWDHPDRPHATLVFDTERIDEPAARRIVDHLKALLVSAAAAPTTPLSRLALFTPDRPAAIAPAAPAGATPEQELTVLVGRHAQANRDAPAVLHLDQVLTRGELDDRATALAGQLTAAIAGPAGGPGHPVAGFFPAKDASAAAVAALAAARIGARYLPLESDHPWTWNVRRLTTAGVRVLLTAADPPAGLPADLVVLDILASDRDGGDTDGGDAGGGGS
ncbi:condensation domain-containing protein, partial [Candidatus Frankia nodulisporulans]